MNLKKMWKRFWNLNVHNHEGFTLVELIIVIAILAILSAVAVAGYSAYIKKANEGADKATLAQINSAFAAACANNGVDWIGIKTNAPELVKDVDNNKVTGLKVNGQITEAVAADFLASIGSGFTFKVYEVSKLNYNSATGCFELGNYAVNQQLAQIYKDSGFSDLEIEYLMNQMDSVVEFANGKFANHGELLDAYRTDEKFIAICQKFDSSYPNIADADAKRNIEIQALVLYTSQQSADRDAQDLLDAIVNSNGNYIMDDELDLVANATMYSLGLLFAESADGQAVINSDSFSYYGSFDKNDSNHIVALMQYSYNADDDGNPDIFGQNTVNPFTVWVKNNEDSLKNVEGFQAALGMITENQDNLNHEDILEDGYGNDKDLIAELEKLLGGG